jgi:hypothetical protein
MNNVGCADVGSAVGNDVVTIAAMEMIDAIAAFQTIVTRSTPKRVVPSPLIRMSFCAVPPSTT